MWLSNIEFMFCCGIPLPYIDIKIAMDYLMTAFSPMNVSVKETKHFS